MSKSQKIGIFAGSFDPIHAGHMACAKSALEVLGLDRVLFVVEPRPRRKQGVKAFEHRSAMVQKAIVDKPAFQHLLIDDPHCTTTETLPMLRERFVDSELYLIMGDDIAAHIASWPRSSELLSEVQLAVVLRRMSRDMLVQQLDKLEKITSKNPRVHILDVVDDKVSSTAIRKQLKTEGYSKLVDKSVLAYIQEHNIYGSSGFGS